MGAAKLRVARFEEALRRSVHAREFLDLLRTAPVARIAMLLAESPELARVRDDVHGDTALSTAVIARDDAALVELLIGAGADVREHVPGLRSPIFTFARSVAVAEALARAGADWSDPEHGASALSSAAHGAEPGLVIWLIARGARPGVAAFRNARYDARFIEPLLAVCSRETLDALLVDCLGLDVDGRAPDRRRTTEVVARLLRAGANPKSSDALHHAAALDHAEIVRLLVHAGHDANRPDKYGHLALVGAAYEAAHDAVAALLELGADPDRENAHGQSARTAATELDDDILRALLRPRAVRR